ncbi:alkaline phosphatase family protein [Mesorhizobium sp. AaZ16]|uniref:alkaline phosphatase family protein n=1 Tax=Mesorhizobium sp. AaZ16 TaxID=3402289 RepID=UPI00374EBF52
MDHLAMQAEAVTKRRFSPYLSLAALGLAILLITFPFEIIRANAAEIQAPGTYLIYFLLSFVLLTALFTGVSLFLPARVVKLLAIVLASYAISIIIADYFFPLDIGPLETGSEQATASLQGQLWQLAIFAVGAGLLYIIPEHLIGSAAAVFTAVLVASNALTTFPALQDRESSIAATAAPANTSSHGFNIYQLIFDSYYGPWFEFARHELGMDEGTFAGFTHYIDAKSNYWNTDSSFPSFLSGTTYALPMKVSAWEKQARRDSLITDLNTYGYRTSAYALYSRGGLLTNVADFRNEISGSADFPLVVDFVLLRTAPPIARPAMMRKGRGAGSILAELIFDRPSGDMRVYESYRQFVDYLAEEPRRPATGNYTLFHSYPPHPPYILDRHGNLENSTYEEQLLLATSMMKQFIEVLKETGRYDNSLIILMSDHGDTAPGSFSYRDQPMRYFIKMSTAKASEIAAVDLRRMNGRLLEARYSPLMLIKPPAGCGDPHGPLRVKEGLVQLKDLRRFINAIVKDPKAACEYPAASSVLISHGLVPLSEDGKRKQVDELRNRRISQYLIDEHLEWHILEDTEFEY